MKGATAKLGCLLAIVFFAGFEPAACSNGGQAGSGQGGGGQGGFMRIIVNGGGIVGTDVDGGMGKDAGIRDTARPTDDARAPKLDTGTSAMPDAEVPACDIFKQDCGAKMGCYPINALKVACQPAGTFTPGIEQCIEDIQCPPGYLCGGAHGGSPFCYPICGVNKLCAKGETCFGVLAGPAGAGYCQP